MEKDNNVIPKLRSLIIRKHKNSYVYRNNIQIIICNAVFDGVYYDLSEIIFITK